MPPSKKKNGGGKAAAGSSSLSSSVPAAAGACSSSACGHDHGADGGGRSHTNGKPPAEVAGASHGNGHTCGRGAAGPLPGGGGGKGGAGPGGSAASQGGTTTSSSGNGQKRTPPAAAPPPPQPPGSGAGARAKPVVVDKAQVIRLAGQYTPCAGCSAAVKALLARPVGELRLLAAVFADDPAQNCLLLRDQYLLNPQRTAQLLETFPLQAMAKKVQPQGGGLRCAVHRRAAAMQAGAGHHGHGHRGQHGGHHHHHYHHHHESWDWEEAWERLPGELKARVATIELAALEAATHQATATHRFCVDCKHNVVTALDVLAGRFDPQELENKEEYNAELFKPFAGRVLPALPPPPPSPPPSPAGDAAAAEGAGEGGGTAAASTSTSLTTTTTSSSSPVTAAGSPAAPGAGQRSVLACDVEDVEELISWHEDFDSQEYAASGQRHAATLEHGQREICSLVGALLLAQLRASWQQHTAQVQAEQYLFHLVVQALRMQLGSGSVVAKAAAAAPPGQHADGLGGIDGAKAAELAASKLLEEEAADESGGGGGKKSKSKRKKERRAKAKARKEEEEEDEVGEVEERGGSPSSSSASSLSGTAPSLGGKKGKANANANGTAKKKHQPPQQAPPQPPQALPADKAGKANGGGGDGLCLLQSCFNREAEERLLRALGADSSGTHGGGVSGGSGGIGPSLLDQLGPFEDGLEGDDLEGDEGIDPALLREMEELKGSLEAKAEHREHLRSKLASQFQRYCSTADAAEASGGQKH